MKSPIVLSLILFVGLLVSGAGIFLAAQGAEPLVLARVSLTEAMTRALPVYAQLQDAAGKEYAVVLAPRAQVEASGAPYGVFETAARASDYVIARERRAGARAGVRANAARYAPVVYDDGRQIIARATLDQAQALAELGFDLRRLRAAPLVWREPLAVSAPRVITPDPVVAAMMAQVQATEVYTRDGQLSGEWPVTVGGAAYTMDTRNTRSGTPILKATQYVYEHMQALGLTVSYQNWSEYGVSNRNVIGEITGATRPDEIVLITAHLDDMPSSGRAPGADDNASGSVGVLTAADILSPYRFERTVRFVFFTGEEQGLYGSDQYATSAYARGDNIIADYNMDMIAWDAVDGPTLRLHTRTRSNPGYAGDLAIANLFLDVVSAYGLSSSLTPIITADGDEGSDQASFWYQGYAAIMAIEDDYDDFNDNYHTSSDLLAALNLNYFTNFVKASVGTAAHLAYPLSGTPPPTNTGTRTATPTNTGTPTATPTKKLEVCGNGILQVGEQCDDGNTNAGDGCSATCQSELSPGGGWAKTDCTHEWLTNPVSAPDRKGLPSHRIECTDDNSACDFGTAGDHACTFHVALCFNAAERRFACTPTDVARVDVLTPFEARPRDATDSANRDAVEGALAGLNGVVRGRCGNSGLHRGQLCAANSDCDSTHGSGDGVCKGRFVSFATPLATGNACTSFASIRVPLRQIAFGFRRASRVLRLKVTRSNGSSDTDTLTLVCQPAS